MAREPADAYFRTAAFRSQALCTCLGLVREVLDTMSDCEALPAIFAPLSRTLDQVVQHSGEPTRALFEAWTTCQSGHPAIHQLYHIKSYHVTIKVSNKHFLWVWRFIDWPCPDTIWSLNSPMTISDFLLADISLGPPNNYLSVLFTIFSCTIKVSQKGFVWFWRRKMTAVGSCQRRKNGRNIKMVRLVLSFCERQQDDYNVVENLDIACKMVYQMIIKMIIRSCFKQDVKQWNAQWKCPGIHKRWMNFWLRIKHRTSHEKDTRL